MILHRGENPRQKKKASPLVRERYIGRDPLLKEGTNVILDWICAVQKEKNRRSKFSSTQRKATSSFISTTRRSNLDDNKVLQMS